MTTMTPPTRHGRSHAAPADTGDWRDDAECRVADSDLFFPIGSTDLAKAQTRQAKQICGRCAVRAECLDWAVNTKQVTGIWGGLAEDERRELMAIQGDAAWVWCLDRQDLIEQRRAEGATVRGLAEEIGVRYELFRKVIKYFEFERNTLAAAGQGVAA